MSECALKVWGRGILLLLAVNQAASKMWRRLKLIVGQPLQLVKPALAGQAVKERLRPVAVKETEVE